MGKVGRTAAAAASSSNRDNDDFLTEFDEPDTEEWAKYAEDEEEDQEALTPEEPKPKTFFSFRATGENPFCRTSRIIRKHIVHKPWFDNVILVAIAANCLVMCFDDPQNPDKFKSIEWVFAAIFLLEMLFKWAALGFWGEYKGTYACGDKTDKEYIGYFKDPWNVLDFIIVLSSISLFFDGANLSSIRVLRVLRPLRTLNKIPQLKALVETILNALPVLLDIVWVLLFLFIIFSIIGVQLFKGKLHRRCFNKAVPPDAPFQNWEQYPIPATEHYMSPDEDQFCSQVVSKDCTGDFNTECFSGDCPEEYPRCLEIALNPMGEVVSFDNVPEALLQIFWIVSLEMWVDQLYMMQDAFSMYVWPYYVIVTILVSFFATNLFLAAVEEMYPGDEDDEEESLDDEYDTWFERLEPGQQKLYDEIYEVQLDKSRKAQKKIQRMKSMSSFQRLSSMKNNFELEELNGLIAEVNDGIDKDQDGGKTQVQLNANPDEIKIQNENQMKEDFKLAYQAWLDSEEEPYNYTEGKSQLVKYCNYVALHPYFSAFIVGMIILNTIALAIYWPSIPDDLKDALEVVNNLLTWVFFIEMVIKITGLGFDDYWNNETEGNWNRFDFGIVWVSVIEFLILISISAKGGALSALRSFRLLRVLRLAGQFKSLRILLVGVMASVSSVFWLCIIFMLFLFMFSILGQSLFGADWESPPNSGADWTFGKNIWWSCLAVFQVVTGDAWNEVMVDGVIVAGNWSSLYFILALGFGTFIILNIFIAILLNNMSLENEDKWMQEDMLEMAKQLRSEGVDEFTATKQMVWDLRRRHHERELMKKLRSWKPSRDKTEMLGKSFGIFKKNSSIRILCNKVAFHWSFSLTVDTLIIVNCVFLALEDANHQDDQIFQTMEVVFIVIFMLEMIIKMIAMGVFPQPFFQDIEWQEKKINPEEREKFSKVCNEYIKLMHEEDESIKLGEVMNTVVHKILESDDGFQVIQFSKAHDIRLVFDEEDFKGAYIMTKVEHGGRTLQVWMRWEKRKAVRRPDVIRVCQSYNLSSHNYNSYMSSNWDRLDCFVVLCGLFSLFFKEISVFRVLRAIRPLRVAVRSPQIKVVIGAIVKSIPGVVNAIFFIALFWFIIAIIGVHQWSGKLWGCYDEDGGLVDDPDLTKQTCLEPNVWENLQWNFDDVFQAIHTMFCVATLSGWNETMYMVSGSRGKDEQLVVYNNPWVGIYFIILIIICSFFSLNLIVSVVIDKFERIKEEKNGSAFLTEEQSKWVKRKRLFQKVQLEWKVPAPEDPTRRMCYDLVEKPSFDAFIMGCIILNTIFMAMEYYRAPDGYVLALFIIDAIFIAIFTIEAGLKITAYGFSAYIYDNWNKFDFVVVIIGLITLIPSIGVGVNVIRLLRIARVLRLIQKAKKIRVVFFTLVYASPSLVNIGTLIFVVMFIYAVIGMFLFGQDGCGYLNTEKGETPDMEAEQCGDNMDKVNFSNFPLTLGLLFRVATEDGWTDLYATYQTLLGDNQYQITIYFCSYFAVCVLVMFNLFIAVILDVWEDNKTEVKQEDMMVSVYKWRDEWQLFDPDCIGRIKCTEFLETIIYAPEPAGLGGRSKADSEHLPSDIEVFKRFADLHLVASRGSAKAVDNSWGAWFRKVSEFCTCNSKSESDIESFDEGKFQKAGTFDQFDQIEMMSTDPNDSDFEDVGDISADDWYVDYNNAVTAVSVYVLEKKFKEDMGVQIWPKKHEKHIATWFNVLHPEIDFLQYLKQGEEAMESPRSKSPTVSHENKKRDPSTVGVHDL